MKTNYDVIIVGGGMVGSTLACALAESALKIAVIEKNLPAEIQPSDDYDLRVSAISHSSQQVFEHLGVWSGIRRRRCCAYEKMHVWHSQGDAELLFDAADSGVKELGHIIENRVIQLALLERIKQHDNVDLISGQSVDAVQYQPQNSQLTLENGSLLSGRLLVGADGAHSMVRGAAGIELEMADYDQKGIVCVVTPEKHHQHTAWQRFLSTGPLAFLPLSNGQCSIVWSADSTEAEQLLTLDDEVFCKQLSDAFDGKLGRIESVSSRAAFPLIRRHAHEYIKDGLVLVGDAAHTIHPLAGQGVNLGLMDAASLAEVMNVAIRHRRDFASYQTLRKYERWRRGENQLMMYSMSAFKNLFGNKHRLLSKARNLGLALVQKSAMAKSALMRRAMGFDGDLPAIARDNWNREAAAEDPFQSGSGR
ncbi:MAG: UbiH/UbiF/VisC/COQ6 family ubiquinone biosynthesis hydroxylase [Gammaproteobacteria bacterium]|nr:UbiH/UbiF/VisC/COQ6 family ubiquinone biosynthesis hydroxylase [Gammaproteobacteria bacterium]